MYEENMMDDETPQTTRSESAFSGTSSSIRSDASVARLPFEVQCKSYLVRATNKVRFDLWKPSLEKKSRVRFEDGRMYVIGGTIDGIERFESRHVSNGNPHLYVFAEEGSKVVPGDECTLVVETLEEKRRFAVVPGKRGPVVRLTRSLFQGLGVPTEESAVVELTIRRPEDGTAGKVYSRWDPMLGFMELQLGGVGFVVGDEVEVVTGRKYNVEEFIEDFRTHKLSELANVELRLQNGSLTATADGVLVPVERHWLATHGLKVALKLELGRRPNLMKFEFDGKSVEARLGNSDCILECNAVGNGVDVRYTRTAGQVYVMRMVQKPLLESVQSFDWLVEGIRVVEHLSVPQGIHIVEISAGAQEIARRKLNETTDGTTYKKLRGDIGEEIVKRLIPDMGMELLYDHPWSKLGPKYGSLRHGPDFMVTCADSGLIAYLEGKWHEDVIRAFGEAKDQVTNHFRLKPDWKGVKVAGAYIAILDWRITSTAIVWVERVA